jgi:hypothetical protein
MGQFRTSTAVQQFHGLPDHLVGDGEHVGLKTLMPIASAAFGLMTNAYFTGACNARSAGWPHAGCDRHSPRLVGTHRQTAAAIRSNLRSRPFRATSISPTGRAPTRGSGSETAQRSKKLIMLVLRKPSSCLAMKASKLAETSVMVGATIGVVGNTNPSSRKAARPFPSQGRPARVSAPYSRRPKHRVRLRDGHERTDRNRWPAQPTGRDEWHKPRCW